MRNVAVTGGSSAVGQRVLALLDRADVDRILAVDHTPSLFPNRAVRLVSGDVSSAELESLLAGVDTVVHLAWDTATSRDPERLANANVERTRRLLDAAGTVGVTTLVHLSSATVYGAWGDNPVPLTEQAPLRPNPGFVDGVHHAEAERLVSDWADAHPGAAVTVLRPVPVTGPGVDGWLTRAFGRSAPLRVGDANPPRQFVHVDDVALAVVEAARSGLIGPFNVTPDGWIPGDVVANLVGGRPLLPIPARLTGEVASWVWNLRLSEVPPSLLPLLEHPWVVANDRLRATGWEPRYSNEEALIAGRSPARWREMSPQRRQQLAFAVSGLGLVGAVAAVIGLLRRLGRVDGTPPAT